MMLKLGVVAHACHPSIQNAMARGSSFQGQLWLNETLVEGRGRERRKGGGKGREGRKEKI